MKRLLGLFCAVVLVLGLAAGANAQGDVKAKLKSLKPADYPTQPIEFVVVYPAGGGMDVTARLLAKYFEKYTDQRVVVVNRAGGGGLIGHTYLATSAKPDGYTMGVVSNAFWTDALTRAKGKWTYHDLVPLALINYDATTWVVSTDGPFKDKSVKEVVETAKAKPNTVRLAIVPDMSFQFLAESVEMATGAKFLKVPFQGGAPGMTALLGGHVDIATGFYSEYRGHLEAGKVRVLSTAGDEPSPQFPNVPTLNRAFGRHDLGWLAWRYAGVPKGVPADRARYLEAGLAAALHDPELIEEYRKLGATVPAKLLTAKETADEMERLYQRDREFFVKTGRIAK